MRRFGALPPTSIAALAVALGCAAPQQATPVRSPSQPPHIADETGDAEVASALQRERAQLPPAVAAACSSDNAWHPALSAAARAAATEIIDALPGAGVEVPAARRGDAIDVVRKRVFWSVVRNLLIGARLHNVGVFVVPGRTTADGQPLRIYRSAFTPNPGTQGSCVHALLASAGVRHIVNLYAGPMTTQDLEDEERRAVTAAGGTYANARDDARAANWREHAREGGADREAMLAVAAIIRDQILRPAGTAPRGHVQIHCGGGMHRTGMVMGVVERCLGGESMPAISARYKAHVGWRSAQDPGGFEAQNIAFIRDFDCSLLGTKPRS